MLLLKRLFALIAFISLAAANSSCNQKKGEEQFITVAAASDLASAFAEVRAVFEQRTQIRVRLNLGSTGQLTQQIEQGAPVDLFAAADSASIDELESKGLIVPGTRAQYGRGRVTLWTRGDSKLELRTLNDLLKPEVTRIAIANPQHAPYGMAAREALQSLELWERMEPRLVFGENIRQTLQYAETGNVDAALVALSLSIGSGGKWVLVPEELHRPLNQTLGIIKGAKNEAGARQFAAFVAGEGRPVMRRYGFLLPGEEAAR